MKTNFKSIFVFLILIFQALLHSQNEAAKWYFGFNSALDFMTSPPTTLTNNAMATISGCSSIADPAGNLQFYTDGINVYNNQHVLMANGTGLAAGASSQKVIIAKQPGNTNLYYVVTAANVNSLNVGVRYSVVDMSLAAGLGSVTIKNAPIVAGTVPRLTGALHCNGTDIWIVAHKDSSNKFLSYSLTAAGLNTVPVISSVGTVYGSTITNSSFGCMKLSPNAKKLAAAHIGPGGGGELFDFDNATGQVSNPLFLPGAQGAFSCEFSPDGTKLYCSNYGANQFYKWDICAGSNSAIVNSLITFTTVIGSGVGILQLALNGKLYVVRIISSAATATLGVINDPNAPGTLCNYVDLGQALTGNSNSYSLPNFISSYFKQLPQPFTSSVNAASSCLTASFTAPPSLTLNTACSAASNSYSSMYWLFGDPASGAANTSSASNTTHLFSGAGTYTVKLVLNGNCSYDTLRQVLTVIAPPTLSVSGNFTICSGQSATLNASGANTYSWSNGPSSSSVVISPTLNTLYTVSGTNTLSGCSGSKSFSVVVSKCLGISETDANAVVIWFYPNPSAGNFTIECESQVSVTIYDQLGRLVLKQDCKPGRTHVSNQHLSPGVYTATALSDNKIYNYKLIVVE